MKYGLMRANDFYRPLGLFEELDHRLGQLFEGGHKLSPVADFSEGEKTLHLSIDLPGMSKEDVDIEVKNGILSVSGERKSSRQEGGFSERVYGSFKRAFTLPKSADGDQIQAKFTNGVLDIAIAKREEVKTKKIDIL